MTFNKITKSHIAILLRQGIMFCEQQNSKSHERIWIKFAGYVAGCYVHLHRLCWPLERVVPVDPQQVQLVS